MNTEHVNLNLARKWRSRNFDQIVGQDLAIRMLRNSLYLSQFFPVYLFAGQRGCGKTSTARVFASAINCANLSKFQKNPKKCHVPCLECESCCAMLSGNHPDFIEIDAASHTGVDNVRQIIESSSYMPLMGKKKIYLIDEAHMLSKAAFNAFLKILEEPPPSVIFILATTNPQKIIETVRSRCFQLLFKAVDSLPLLEHLKNVCKKERIDYDQQGLQVIVNESQGSVRDSINLLEQVRFSSGSITKRSAQLVLGHIDDDRLLHLFELLLTRGPQDVLKTLKELKYELFSAQYFWEKLVELSRAALWIKNGVEPNFFKEHCATIKKLVKDCSLQKINDILQLFYDNESVFIKTTAKHSLLEMILIQISQKNDFSDKSGASSAPQKVAPIEHDEDEEQETEYEEEEEEYEEEEEVSSKKPEPKKECSKWDQFLTFLSKHDDPLLSSIFKQGKFISFDEANGNLKVEFLKQFSFFKDSIKETYNDWFPLLSKVFSDKVTFVPMFTVEGEIKLSNKTSERRVLSEKPTVTAQPVKKQSFTPRSKKNNFYSAAKSNTKKDYGKIIDVSDVQVWKKANTLLGYFPGSIREMQDV